MTSKPRRVHLRTGVGATSRKVISTGLRPQVWQDLYHWFMTVTWPVVFAGFGAFFFAFNLLFAAVYSLRPDDIANLNPPGYWGFFFFSVETFATVGYGDMHPQSPFAHTVAAIEIYTGLMSLALITGMMFARFSRPKARFMFARYAVIRLIDGKLTLMLRAANARQNIVMEATAHLRLMRQEQTPEGFSIRRIYDLPLRRTQHPSFVFGWTLMHVIDACSPMAAATEETLTASASFLLLTIIGTDETTGQTLMARQGYSVDMLRWNHGFVDILSIKDGVDYFDYSRFDEIEPL